MIAQRVVIGVTVQIDAAAILWQRIFHDLGQHRAGAVGHEENLVGEVDRLIHVVGDHERGLPGLQKNAPHLVLQRAARQRVERRERLIHQHDLRRDREARAIPRVKRASTWSSSMPTTPIRRMAMMTLVIERLFHSFQTK